MNGSIKSDSLSAGSGGTIGDDGVGIDGDNINVVIRVRPLNPRELKSGDESILTFPGDGGVWVSYHWIKSDYLFGALKLQNIGIRLTYIKHGYDILKIFYS